MEDEYFDIQDTEGYWETIGSEVGDGWKNLYKPVVEYIRRHNEICPRKEEGKKEEPSEIIPFLFCTFAVALN